MHATPRSFPGEHLTAIYLSKGGKVHLKRHRRMCNLFLCFFPSFCPSALLSFGLRCFAAFFEFPSVSMEGGKVHLKRHRRVCSLFLSFLPSFCPSAFLSSDSLRSLNVQVYHSRNVVLPRKVSGHGV